MSNKPDDVKDLERIQSEMDVVQAQLRDAAAKYDAARFPLAAKLKELHQQYEIIACNIE